MKSLLNDNIYIESNNHYFGRKKIKRIILHHLVVEKKNVNIKNIVNNINNLFKQQVDKHRYYYEMKRQFNKICKIRL